MIFNLKNPYHQREVLNYINSLIELKTKAEVKIIKDTRTSKQNRALHKLFQIISNQLNELGLEFHYTGLVVEKLSSRYTSDIVKNFIWRPIQIALFNKESTTKLNTNEINEITDVLIKWFGEKGIEIQFPSIDQLKDD